MSCGENHIRPRLDLQAILASLMRAQHRLLELEMDPSIREKPVLALLEPDDVIWMVDELDLRLQRLIDRLARERRARFRLLPGGAP